MPIGHPISGHCIILQTKLPLKLVCLYSVFSFVLLTVLSVLLYLRVLFWSTNEQYDQTGCLDRWHCW